MKQEIRRRYTVLISFLGQALGPAYEVVLEELDTDNPGIIAIANADINGRKIGSPLTNAELKMIMQREYEHSDYKLNYIGRLPNGKVIRSSTMFIKDEGKLVGLLCINFDDSRFQQLGETMLKLIHPDEFIQDHFILEDVAETKPGVMLHPGSDAEHFQNDVTGLMEEIFESVTAEFITPMEHLTQEERLRIVEGLYERGMFQLHGSVQYAAQKLFCSQASMYRYLKKARKT